MSNTFLAVLFGAWWTLNKLSRQVKTLKNKDLLELMIFANRLALMVYMISGCFVSRLYTEGMWILIALPVCIARAVENEVRVEAEEKVVIACPEPALLGNRRGLQLAP